MTFWTKILGLTVFLILLSGCSGCNADRTITAEDAKKLNAKAKEVKTYDPSVPDACTLLTTEEIASTIGVDAGIISVKDGSNLQSLNVRSCFFRWEHNGVPNSGVLVQAQSNPLPEEFPNWATTFIKSKIESGDKTLDGEVFLYKPFNGGGIEGAYNHTMNKYFWRKNDKIIYTLTFNIFEEEAAQLAYAEKLARLID